MLLPPEIQPFKPYGTGMAAIQDAASTTFYAVLGGIEKGNDAEKRASFKVYVWKEKDGVATLIPIDNPPNNAPTFCVKNGGLVLLGILESPPGTKTLVERDIPGFVAPALDLATILTGIIMRLADRESKIYEAFADAAVDAVRAALAD